MAFPSLQRKDQTGQAASTPNAASSAPFYGAGNPDANRLALLELMRAWEAARVKQPPDPREKVQNQQHLERVITRYALRVRQMSGVATPSDRESAMTALALVRSAVQNAQTVLLELNRLLNGGGTSGSSQPAA